MVVDLEQIKKLRQSTGAGIQDIQKTLAETKGNIKETIKILRKKGLLKAREKESRQTREGVVDSYIHSNKKIGAMIELTCETDFVARNSEFINLAHDLAMQVAATNPKYIKSEDIPQEIIQREREIYLAEVQDLKKPSRVLDKIIQGKFKKFYSEVCLLKQLFIKDENLTIEELIAQKVLSLGENIQIREFVRFEV